MNPENEKKYSTVLIAFGKTVYLLTAETRLFF